MLDQQMREQRPLLAWKQGHQVLLDLDRIGVARERQALAHACDVRIDDDSLVALERVAEDDIRRLASHAGKLDELLHLGWYDAAVMLGDRGRHADETLRFVAKESGALDHLLELLGLRRRKSFGRCITTKERGGDHVHALVGALRAEDRRDEELERCLEVERAVRVRIASSQAREDLGGALRRGCATGREAARWLLHWSGTGGSRPFRLGNRGRAARDLRRLRRQES